MSINNNVFAESRFWQCFSGKNRLNFHSTRVRRTRERLSFVRLYRKRAPEVEANPNCRAVRFRYSSSVNQDLTETRQPMGLAASKNVRFAKGINGV